MKKYSILLFLSFLCITRALSQNSRESIEKRADMYFAASEQKDWSAVVGMVYPKLFELVPKEQMIEVFQNIESEGLKMELKDFNIRQISDIVTHEGEKFARIDYNMEMFLQFTSVEYRDAAVQTTVNTNFQNLYGAENVTWNKEDFSFDIKTTKSMFAIADEGTMDWYFIENDSTRPELTNMIIPEAVRGVLLKKN